MTLTVILKETEEFMPQLNMINLALKQNGTSVLEDHFGFHGASQWDVYGPYWDMWDKEQYAVCPYQNDKLNCNPGNLPEFGSDATNCHIRTKFKYLDEATLIKEDLPSELPFSVEKGTEKYTRADLYSFNGPQCCYLVREFKSDERIEDIRFICGASCPFECYLDGKLIQFRYTHDQGAVYRNIENITFTGEKQRLVIKLASRITNFSFSVAACKGNPSRTRAYSPYLSSYSIKKGR